MEPEPKRTYPPSKKSKRNDGAAVPVVSKGKGNKSKAKNAATFMDESGLALAAAGTSGASQSADGVCFANRLPDHLMVKLFNYLDRESIAFVLPLVCKRWSKLARAVELWKDGHIVYGPFMPADQKKLFFKCMMMAPALARLTLELDWKDGPDFAVKFNKHSPAVIDAVEFIYDNMPPEVMFTILRKYKNNLEEVHIDDTYTPYIESDVKRIWNHIQNLTKLKHLTIEGAALLYHKVTIKQNAPCWATLKTLDVKDSSYEDMNTVKRLISSNPNWSEVYLSVPHSSLYRGEVKSLAKCVNLTCVQVPFCKEIKSLLSCEKLDSLILNCPTETESEIKGVISHFDKNPAFPNLKMLKVIDASSAYVKLILNLIRGRHLVNLINLVTCEILSNELIEILGAPPALEKLYLYEIGGECVAAALDQLAVGLVPNLKELSVQQCPCEEGKACVKAAVSHLKKERPNVKLSVDSVSCDCKSTEDSCGTQAGGMT